MIKTERPTRISDKKFTRHKQRDGLKLRTTQGVDITA